jgi:hypothetical protein
MHFRVTFYLSHIEYEESIGFVTRKMKILFLIFTFSLFMAKKHDLSEKKIRMSRAGAVAVAVERKICATPTA